MNQRTFFPLHACLFFLLSWQLTLSVTAQERRETPPAPTSTQESTRDPVQEAARELEQQEADGERPLSVPAGLLVELRLDMSLASNQVSPESWIPFTVASDVMMGKVLIIEKGAHARGRIVKVKRAGRWGRAGEMLWEIKDVVAVDGSRLALRLPSQEKMMGDSEHARTAVRVGGGIASLALLGPYGVPYAAFFLIRAGLNKGADATLPAGLLFETFTAEDREIKGKSTSAPTATKQY